MNLQFANSILNQIKLRLDNHDQIIPLKADFKLTKTSHNYSEAYLLRDFDLETRVYDWISRMGGMPKLMKFYQNHDERMSDMTLPRHFAMRILAGIGSITSGSNIFMFFPHVLGLHTKCEDDVFGFEFIDVWSNILRRTVIPCLNSGFSLRSQISYGIPLQNNLEEVIYLASIFHEVGHRVGPFKVSPEMNPNLKISPFQLDVLGELYTDSLLVLALQDAPEILSFVTFQRLFWFGRRGFSNDPISGMINSDNDAWIGSYLWNKLESHNAITLKDGAYEFCGERALEVYAVILKELNELGAALETSSHHVEIANGWMQTHVEYELERGFKLPKGLSQYLESCQQIAEVPHFQPIYSYQKFKELYGHVS